MTSAQGQEMTRKHRALYTACPHSIIPASGGTTATTAAARQTMGVYTRAKRVINF